jgi:hypothetical protein
MMDEGGMRRAPRRPFNETSEKERVGHYSPHGRLAEAVEGASPRPGFQNDISNNNEHVRIATRHIYGTVMVTLS